MKKLFSALFATLVSLSATAQLPMPKLQAVKPGTENTLEAFNIHKANSKLIRDQKNKYCELFLRAFGTLQDTLESLDDLPVSDSVSLANTLAYCDTIAVNMALSKKYFEIMNLAWAIHVKAAQATACTVNGVTPSWKHQADELSAECDKWLESWATTHEELAIKAKAMMEKLLALHEVAELDK